MARFGTTPYKWRDVLSIVNGKSQKDVESPNGEYPIYGSGGIIGYATDFLCPENTVVLGRKGSINKPIFVTVKFWNVDTAFGLIANKEKLLPLFLFYFCVFFDFEKLNTTVTIPSLTKANLLNITIALPCIEIQEKIIKRLSTIDKIISQKEQQLSKLDQLVKARFVEMFGDPVRNEKGWPVVLLEEVAEIRIGPFGSLLHKEDYIEGGHALVNPSHITEGKIRIDSSLTVSLEKYQELSAYHLDEGNIVLGRRGEMGRCAVVQSAGLLCGTGCMIIRPNKKMKPYFLQTILSSPTYKKKIEDKAVGVTMMNLNVPIVSSLPVPLLPLDLQEKFISLLQQTEKSKSTVKQSLEKLETLKKSLMQEYFG